MKYRNISRLIIYCAIFALLNSCSAKTNYEVSKSSYAEEKTNEAVKAFYERFNENRFDDIADNQSDIVTSKEYTKNLIKELRDVKDIYGSVKNIELEKITVKSPQDNRIIASCIYKIDAEKGRFFQIFYWHIVNEETRLAEQQIFSYDKDRKLQILVQGSE